MAFVTPVSLTLTSDKFLSWSRDVNEVKIYASWTLAAQVTAINDALAAGHPIAFERGGTYTNLPGFTMNSPIKYIAWFGNLLLPRPVLRFIPSVTRAFHMNWCSNTNTTQFWVIGCEFDGANSGNEEPYDDWVKADFNCFWGKTSNGDTTTHVGIVFEDNIFRRFDTPIRLVNDNARQQPGVYVSAGSFKPAIRRNLFLDAMGRDGHSIGIYGEGWAHGWLIEQNYFSHMGYTRRHGRNGEDFRDPTQPVANDRSHGNYFQQYNGSGVIRENIYYQCAANMAQHRTPGTFDYNVGFYCALSTNTGDVGSHGLDAYESRIHGNLFAYQQNISDVTNDARGKAWAPSYTPLDLTFTQNIAFGRYGTAVGGAGAGAEITNVASATGNVLLGWHHIGGRREGINVNGLSFKVGSTYYEIRAAADRPSSPLAAVTQPPHDYDDNYQVNDPYTDWTIQQWIDAGYPHISEADDDYLRSRRLGEWRERDHVSYYIDNARAKAQAIVLAKYGVAPSTLDPIDWSATHVVVTGNSDGNTDNTGGGNQDDDPTDPPTPTPDVATAATITVAEALADYNFRIGRALTDHSGTIALTGDGEIPSSAVTATSAVVVTAGSGTIVKRKPFPAISPTNTTDATFRMGSGGSGTVNGGIWDAQRAYSALGTYTGSGTTTFKNLTARNASFKQINFNSAGTVENVRVESDVVGDGGTTARPMACQWDAEGTVVASATITGLTVGMFYGSTEGQSVKVARVTTTRITRLITPIMDASTWYSLILGEELNYVKVSDSLLPRKIAHFADATGGADTLVGTLVVSNTTIGNMNEQTYKMHDGTAGFLARTVVYHRVNFVNCGAICLYDGTPAGSLVTRIFLGCTFDTATTTKLIEHADGDSTLTGKIRHAGCQFITRGSGVFNKPSDWDASEITLNAGYSIDALAGAFL